MAARRQSSPTMIAYRDSNGILKYVSAPGAFTYNDAPYDDDYEPLMSSALIFNNDDEDETEVTQRFTATGQPMPALQPIARFNMGMYSAPQHLPIRFTDDSIIPVIVQLPDPKAGQ
jgi:hypothetical protein